MRLQTKLSLATSSLIALTAMSVGGVSLLVGQQSGLQEIRNNLQRISEQIASTAGDPLSSALLVASNYEISVAFQEADGTLTVLQELAGGEQGESDIATNIELSDGEKLVIWQDSSHIYDAQNASMPMMLLATLLLVVVAVFFTHLLLRKDVWQIKSLIATATELAKGVNTQVASQPSSTELKELAVALQTMLEKLGDSRKEMQDFFSDASHELKTPLTVIRGYLELLQTSDLSPEQERAVSRSYQEAIKMQRLIQQLLQLAELGNASKPEFEQLDLKQVFDPLIADFRTLEMQRRVEVAIESQTRVYGDEQLLQQLFSNLLTNFRVHTPEDAVLQVQVTHDGDYIELRFEDSGPGTSWLTETPAEHKPERFFQERNRTASGSGLGLSIINRIVDLHGGKTRFFRSALGGFGVAITIPSIE